MKLIKVLVLTTSFPLRKNSVSGLFVKKLVDSFPSTVKPLVVTPCDNNNEDIDQFRYKVKCFKYAPRKYRILAHSPGGIPAALKSSKFSLLLMPLFLIAMFIKCFIEAKNVDLIHANWSVCGVIAGIVGKLRSKPIVTTIRGEDGNKADTSIVFRLFLKAAIILSARVVGVSDSMVDKMKLLSKNIDSKIIFIPNGVERSLNKPNVRALLSKNDEIALISVGNLTENKNTILVIQAVRELISQGKKVNFNIVGDGPLKAQLQNKINEYGLSKCIFLWGNIYPEKVYELIRKSDIFILSSFREGRPNVILESMVLGTPIIASNIEGVAELIVDDYTGLLFNPNNCEELVQCIKRISDDIDIQNLLKLNALEYIEKNNLFWDKSAKKYFDVYARTLLEH